MSDLVLTILLMTTVCLGWGYIGYRLFKSEKFFKWFAAGVFGYFGTVATLQTIIGLAKHFNWNF